MPEPTKAMIAAELAEVKRQLEASNLENDRFKRHVAVVATRYARDNQWCSTIDEALSEMDLKRVEHTYAITVLVETTFSTTLTDEAMGRAISDSGEIDPALEKECIERVVRDILTVDEVGLASNDYDVMGDIDTVEWDDYPKVVSYSRSGD